jgi:hypothetical protein
MTELEKVLKEEVAQHNVYPGIFLENVRETKMYLRHDSFGAEILTLGFPDTQQ